MWLVGGGWVCGWVCVCVCVCVSDTGHGMVAGQAASCSRVIGFPTPWLVKGLVLTNLLPCYRISHAISVLVSELDL